jgi:dipeptidyl aminopeptidase/acylaminoacyl peptidase
MLRPFTLALAAVAAFVGPARSITAPPDPLIPLHALLGEAAVVAPQLSPDGKLVCWIAPENGAPNLWVARVDDMTRAHAVTHYAGRGIQAYDVSGRVMIHWTSDSDRLVYPMDHNGDEQWNWWVCDLTTGRSTDFTPREHAEVRLYALGEHDARHALVGINDRDPKRHDTYLADLETGDLTLVERNERFVRFYADGSLKARIAVEVTPAGEIDVLRSAPDGRWLGLDHIGSGDTAGEVVGFDATGTTLYTHSTHGRDTAALVAWDLTNSTMTTLATDSRVDVGDVIRDPATGQPQAYATNWTRTSWHAIDPAIQPDLDALAKLCEGDYDVVSRSRDDHRWLVHVTRDDGPETWLLYTRASHSARRLFVSHPQLEGLPLAKLHPVVIQSRDSLELVSYVCLPRWTDPDGDGIPSEPLPTIMLVHGGPGDERAEYLFAPFVQWLANRGYAVLYVNFRGSPGFGKTFLNAERLEWGGKMNLDLVDQAQWAIEHGISDPKRIGIMGGSYGGYATLCAMTLTPGVFSCAIDVVGPANLETFIATMPKTWSLDHFARRVGDPRTPEGLAHLKARSPIHFVDRVHEPMLVAQGAHDARVVQAESDSMVAALDRQGVKVTYLLYPDEGHGFHRPGNSTAFNAVTEAFLAANLGGRCEPLEDQLDDSSVLVPVGVDRVPGLAAALAHRPAAKP